MKKHAYPGLSLLAMVLAISLNLAATPAKESVILHFDKTHGSFPQTGLVADAEGNLYGVTPDGGAACAPNGCGIVFELSPEAGGAWKQTTIYTFKGGTADGSLPWSALLFDGKGNLFGETLGGGSGGDGTVFKLTPGPNGTWTESIIFSFPDTDGPYPGNKLTLDNKGNLYGILSYYGGFGGVFELSPQSNGTWTQSILYAFSFGTGDGYYPYGGVVLDGNGNLYGTTSSGGSSPYGYGTVFELAPNGSGGWMESILYNFTGQSDGGIPRAPLVTDAAGNLYGTAGLGGANFGGVVFELTQNVGVWSETVLYSFGANPHDGSAANELAFDAKGNRYGTTGGGGTGCNSPGCGNVFVLAPQKSAPWKETILHQFESADDGSRSAAGLFIDNAAGVLYGTTEYGGGRYGYGTVFLIQR